MALARSSPTIKASYSTSLLVVGKSKRTMHSTLSPSGLRSITPAPPTYLLEDPSMWMLHCGTSSAPWPSSLVNSAMKLAITCPLMAVLGRYFTSNSLSYIAHSAIRPTVSRLFIACCKGFSVNMMIMWAWKYGFNLRATMTKVKASFSIGAYLSSTLLSAQLV